MDIHGPKPYSFIHMPPQKIPTGEADKRKKRVQLCNRDYTVSTELSFPSSHAKVLRVPEITSSSFEGPLLSSPPFDGSPEQK